MKIRRDFLARRRMRAAGGSLLQRVLMWLSIWAYSDAPPAPLPWFRPRGVSLYTAIGNVFKNVAIYRFFLGSTVVIILILDTEFLVKRSLGEEENIFTGFGQFMAMAQAVEVGLGVVWFLAVSGRSQGGEPGAVRACCGSGGPSVCARCAEDNASILSKSETGDLPISQSQATVSKPAGGVGIFIEGTRIEDEIASGSNESNPFADGDASSLHPSVHSNCSNARRTHRRNSSDLSGTGYELDDITNLRARNSINSSQV